MHSEVYYMSKEAADTLNAAKSNGQRIFAIGTTSVRTLESVWNRFGKFEECSGETKLIHLPRISVAYDRWHVNKLPPTKIYTNYDDCVLCRI